MTKGLLGLVFWLFVGFAFTEITVLSLNAWLMHESAGHRDTGSIALVEPAAKPYSTSTATGVLPKAR
jgi:hypothetical protein